MKTNGENSNNNVVFCLRCCLLSDMKSSTIAKTNGLIGEEAKILVPVWKQHKTNVSILCTDVWFAVLLAQTKLAATDAKKEQKEVTTSNG